MKKSLLLFCLVILFGCVKEEPVELPIVLTLNKTVLSTPYNSEQTLTVTGADASDCEWISSNTFVATVYDGRIMANHVGTAKITATYKEATTSCQVTVTPLITLFPDPIIKFGSTKAEVEALEKNTKLSENESFTTYSSSNTKISATTYYFRVGGKLTLTRLFLYKSKIDYVDLSNHLLERYDHLSYGDGKDWYQGNGIYVCVTSSSSLYYNVLYSISTENIMNEL